MTSFIYLLFVQNEMRIIIYIFRIPMISFMKILLAFISFTSYFRSYFIHILFLPFFGSLVRLVYIQSEPCKFALIHSDKIPSWGNSLPCDSTVFERGRNWRERRRADWKNSISPETDGKRDAADGRRSVKGRERERWEERGGGAKWTSSVQPLGSPGK